MKEVLNSTAENSNVRRSFLKDCFHQGRRSTAGRKSGIGNLVKQRSKLLGKLLQQRRDM